MRRPIVRVLYIPKGATKDLHGRESGSDWNLATVGDADGRCEVTTDSVHCSEFGDLFPATGVGIARLIAHALNKLWADSGGDWYKLIAELDGPPPPPPPRKMDRCDKCGEFIEKNQSWVSVAGKSGTYHMDCTPREFGEPF